MSTRKGARTFSARIDASLVDWLTKSARQKRVSRNKLIEDLLMYVRDMERLGWHLHQVDPEIRLTDEIMHDGSRVTLGVDPRTDQPIVLRERAS